MEYFIYLKPLMVITYWSLPLQRAMLLTIVERDFRLQWVVRAKWKLWYFDLEWVGRRNHDQVFFINWFDIDKRTMIATFIPHKK